MQATYTEDGKSYRVTVVSESSDADERRFRLRRLDSLDTGEEFPFMNRKHGPGWFGMGVLRFDDGRCVPDNVYQKTC